FGCVKKDKPPESPAAVWRRDRGKEAGCQAFSEEQNPKKFNFLIAMNEKVSEYRYLPLRRSILRPVTRSPRPVRAQEVLETSPNQCRGPALDLERTRRCS
ncbi:hypothetical protein, partial [uncultured Bosea sp.]|uniref:hypothetical protein n=1 Tax=uncultured Bosea sp. TaxID=211457 RepID=UPI0025EE1916